MYKFMKFYGWSCDALDVTYATKKEAQDALVYAFGGECGDCGFKNKKEVLEHYPVEKDVWEKLVYIKKSNS